MVKRLICWLRGHRWAWLCSTSEFPQYEPDADELYICTRCGITERRPYFRLASVSPPALNISLDTRNEILDDLRKGKL